MAAFRSSARRSKRPNCLRQGEEIAPHSKSKKSTQKQGIRGTRKKPLASHGASDKSVDSPRESPLTPRWRWRCRTGHLASSTRLHTDQLISTTDHPLTTSTHHGWRSTGPPTLPSQARSRWQRRGWSQRGTTPVQGGPLPKTYHTTAERHVASVEAAPWWPYGCPPALVQRQRFNFIVLQYKNAQGRNARFSGSGTATPMFPPQSRRDSMRTARQCKSRRLAIQHKQPLSAFAAQLRGVALFRLLTNPRPAQRALC